MTTLKLLAQCPPDLSYSMSTQTLTCNNPTILATGSSTTANTIVSWIVPSTPSIITQPSVIVGPPNGPATSTIFLSYGVYTVVATNTLMMCQSTQTIVVSQNFRKPSPQIAPTSSNVTVCGNNTVTLGTGNSTVTSGVIGAFVTVVSWQGPPPQTTGTNVTYGATVPGTYTLTIKDSYNGCTSSATTIVPSGAPSFSLNSTSPTSSVSCDGIVTIVNGPSSGYSVSASNGTLIGTPQKTITNLCAGKVVVCLTYTNFNVGCKTCDSLVLGVASGIRENFTENEFLIYPNPAQSIVHIKNLSQNQGTLKVMNIEGKDIETQILQPEKEYKIENLKAGLYFVEVRTENGVFRQKVVITK